MKKLLYIAVGLFFSLNIFAQEEKIIEKNFVLPKSKKLDLDLKFAESITVNTWNKREVQFKAILLLKEPNIEEIHTMDIKDEADVLLIATDYDFEKYNSKDWDCNQFRKHYHHGDSFCVKVKYELTLPKDAKVQLETIAGNIEVKDFKGEMKAKTISGFVDLALAPSHPTRLKFRSVTGEIYTDFDINLDKNSSAFSKKLNAEINGGGNNLLSLETVSGDIFFRKI